MKYVERLQKLQNRALRIYLNANNKQHINNLHNISNVPMLKDRRYYHLSIYAYTRTKLEDYVDIRPIITRRRTAPLLKSYKSNYKVVDRSVYLQTSSIWNSMDADTRNIEDIENFKVLQKTKLNLINWN